MSLMSLLNEMNPWGDVDDVPPSFKGAVDYGLKAYERKQIGDWAIDHTIGDEDKDLAHENSRLDIEMKRRALGFNSSHEYQDSVNNDTHIAARGLGRALQQIPEPGFLEPEGFPFIGDLGKTRGNTSVLSLRNSIAGAKDVESSGRTLAAIFGRFRA